MIAARGAPPPTRFPLAAVALAIVLIAALGIRLYGLDWDDGQDLHPDELFVAKIVLVDRIRLDWPPDLGRFIDPAVSGLNPRSVDPATGEYREFAYGALPLLVTDAVAAVVSWLTGDNWNAADRAYLIGRVLSAVFDTATVGIVYLLGVRLGGRAAGLFAATIAALAPMSIQLAHFFTTDSWLTTFVALCLLLSIRAAERPTLPTAAMAGAAAGLAMATKGSAFALAVVVALALLLPFWRWPGWGGAFPVAAPRRLVRLWLAAGGGALVAFGLFEPFALARPDVYLRSLATQADIVAGRFDVPFTRVFASASPLHAFEQWFLWGFGPAAAALALSGVVLMIGCARRSRPALILIAWFLVYAAIVVSSEVQFLRYLAPLTPVLAVAAGLALDGGRRWLADAGHGRVGGLATVAVLLTVGLSAASFTSVYAGEHPRLAASRWMYATLDPGTTVTAEYWDDALPKDFGLALSSEGFGVARLTVDLYADRPPEDVADGLYAVLRRADAIVLSSNRVESAVRANPWRYPVQGRFYELLADGQLGFRSAGTWERSPRLGPLTFDDRDADESFINYDHPLVRVYLRDEPINRASYDALMAWAVDRPWQPTRYPAGQSLLLDQPVGTLPIVNDARWSAAITGTTGGAVAVWLILLVVLQVAGVPLARVLLGRFVDVGWGFARLLALLVSGYLVWLGASLQLVAFKAVWCAAALVLVGLLGWLARRGGPGIRRSGFRLAAPAVTSEAVFWAVFAVFLGFRFLNPDGWHPLWGGEKPMEFAHLNATLRSAHFPPYDPWFADGYLNYYYYGTYLVAYLLKLTGIPAEIGFNLAQPTVMALLASGVFSLGATLGRSVARRGAAVAGLGSVLLTVLAGNLTSAHQLVVRALAGEPQRLGSFLDWTWDGSRAVENAITEFPFFTGLYADLHAHVVALPITVLGIALAFALAMEPFRLASGSRLAPAVIRLAGLALVLGSLSATNAWDVPVYALVALVAIWMATRSEPRWRRRLGVFLGASAGLVALAYLLFVPFHAHFVAMFGSVAPVADPTPFSEWALHIGGLAAICTTALLVLLIPNAVPQALNWIRPQVLLMVGGGVGLTAAAIGPSLLGTSAAVVGAVAVISVFLLAAGWLVAPGRDPIDRVPVVGGGVLAAAALATGRPVLAVAIAGLAGAASGWLFARTAGVRFWCLLVAAGMGVIAGVELVVVADDLIETSAYRMNTVFKFYNQVWILFAIAAATGAAAMAATARLPAAREAATVSLVASALSRGASGEGLAGQEKRRTANTITGALLRRSWSVFGLALSALVVAGSLAYPLLATGPRLDQRFPNPPPVGTLDALAWMETGTLPTQGGPIAELGFAGDRAAIEWFNREVEGTPVIAEASIGPYRCNGSRISIATGLPTIIGWERHESQQRPVTALSGRVADVDLLYNSPDPREKERILRKYDVAYVVVGDLERIYPVANNECSATGSAAGIAALESMVGTTLEVAFRHQGTVVYRVLPVGSEGRG